MGSWKGKVRQSSGPTIDRERDLARDSLTRKRAFWPVSTLCATLALLSYFWSFLALNPPLWDTLDTVRVSLTPFSRVSPVSFPIASDFLVRILADGRDFVLFRSSQTIETM